jgi:hypothetical protein
MAVYATTDLHGEYELWQQIKNYLKENDTLIYLGDAIDRGDRGFEIFMELLDDPRVYFICGNHEDLMYGNYFGNTLASQYKKDWNLNGGKATRMNIEEIKLLKNLPNDFHLKYVERVFSLPSYATYTNSAGQTFICCHAGFTPGSKWDSLDEFQKGFQYLWNRDHFKDSWPQGYENTYIIHGHTAIQNVLFDIPDLKRTCDFPLIYADGHKINLDIASKFTQTALLYNLDNNCLEVIVKTK